MRAFILSMLAALLMAAAPAAAQTPVPLQGRVALVIGNDAYQSITPLNNPRLDAGRLAGILAANGFEVVSCDGKRPGCFDLTRAGFLDALETLERNAQGAELALVFYAGHGMQLTNAPSNVLAPVDMEFDCADMSMKRAVALEVVFKAVAGARQRIVIVDACRNDPFRQCPKRGSAPVSFGPLTAPEAESFLLVSSTKPGQEALDGIEGEHSPFARALFHWLEKSPRLHFHQLLQLHVAKAVIEGTSRAGFTQVPETLTRGVAPDACLTGSGCAADDRAGALQAELERLRAERGRDQVAETYLALKEKGLSRQLSPEERRRELESLHQVVRELAGQNDTRSEEALARMQAGDAEGAKAIYAEVLAAREQEAEALVARANALAAEKKREAAKAARSLAALEKLTNVARAAELYKKAADLDPADAETWLNYGITASTAGRFDEAKVAFEQAAAQSRDHNTPLLTLQATIHLGDIAWSERDLAGAERLYKAALAMAEEGAKSQPDDAGWQGGPGEPDWQGSLLGAHTYAHTAIGDVLEAQGNLAGALESYKAALVIAERFTNTNPANTHWQYRMLSLPHEKMGGLQERQGNLAEALESFKTVLAIAERLAKTDPTNTAWQGGLIGAHWHIGDVLMNQGELPAALENFKAAFAIAERLARTDPTNYAWQWSLSYSHGNIGGVLQAQGDLVGALESFKAALAIYERLANPTNTVLQRELSRTHKRIGDVLQAQGNKAGALASWRQALAVAETNAVGAEAVETKSSGNPGTATAKALRDVAWYAVFAREFRTALAASERARAIAPDFIRIDANRAHALIFLKRTREARGLYLLHKGKMAQGKPWERVIGDDFVDLSKAGLAHPMMARIERELGIAKGLAAKPRTGREVGER